MSCCRQCRFWDVEGTGLRRVCSSPYLGIEGGADCLYVNDTVRTGPYFGCIHFESRYSGATPLPEPLTAPASRWRKVAKGDIDG